MSEERAVGVPTRIKPTDHIHDDGTVHTHGSGVLHDHVKDDQTDPAELAKQAEQVRAHRKLLAKGADLARTDEGNARRLALYAHDTLRYVKERDRWHHWDGRRWHAATDGDMVMVARWVVGRIYEEAALLPDVPPEDGVPSPRAIHASFAVRSASAKAIREMLFLARGDSTLWQDESTFDANPYLLNFRNCTVDVRIGAWHLHNREDYLTGLVPHNYNPNAPAPRWIALVARTFQDANKDNLTFRFVWKSLGYASLIGDNVEQIIFFLIGEPNTGKTKVVEIPARLLGPDYAHKSKTDLISRRRGGHHDSERYSIVGKRYVFISETSSIFNLDEATVKELTGDRFVTTRQLYKPGELNPPVTWTIILATNDYPNVLEWDDAVERRIIPLPAGPPVPHNQQVKDLDRRIIEEEAEGVLAWLVMGAIAWWADWQVAQHDPDRVKSGLWPLATSVEMERLQYADSQDHIGQFIRECVVLDSSATPPPQVPSQTAKRDVHAAFKRWRGVGEVSNRNKLYARIRRLQGVSVVRDRTFVGLRLNISLAEVVTEAEKVGGR